MVPNKNTTRGGHWKRKCSSLALTVLNHGCTACEAQRFRNHYKGNYDIISDSPHQPNCIYNYMAAIRPQGSSEFDSQHTVPELISVGHPRKYLLHETHHSQSFSRPIDSIPAAKQNPRARYNLYIGMLNCQELSHENLAMQMPSAS